VTIAGWGLESSFYLGLPTREAGYLLLGLSLLVVALTVRKPAIRLPRALGRLLFASAGLLLGAFVLSGAITIRILTAVATVAIAVFTPVIGRRDRRLKLEFLSK